MILNPPKNTSERLLKKFVEALTVNRSLVGMKSLGDMLFVLTMCCKLIEDELNRRR